MAGSGSGPERPRGQLGNVIVASDHQPETVPAGTSPLHAAPITVPGCRDDRLEITARNARRAQAAALCVV
jgi:hypothetical protein